MSDPNRRAPRMTAAHVKKRARESFENLPETLGRKVGRILTGALLMGAPVGIQRFAAAAPWWVPVGVFVLGLEIASRGLVVRSLRLVLTLAADAWRASKDTPADGPGV